MYMSFQIKVHIFEKMYLGLKSPLVGKWRNTFDEQFQDHQAEKKI